MKEKALVIDYKYCTGCHTCEVACKNEKDIPVGEWGIHLEDMGPIQLGGKWHWDYHPIPTALCDLCAERVSSGEEPSCVKHCLAKCMQLVDLDDLPRVLRELGDGASCYIPAE